MVLRGGGLFRSPGAAAGVGGRFPAPVCSVPGTRPWGHFKSAHPEKETETETEAAVRAPASLGLVRSSIYL